MSWGSSISRDLIERGVMEEQPFGTAELQLAREKFLNKEQRLEGVYIYMYV